MVAEFVGQAEAEYVAPLAAESAGFVGHLTVEFVVPQLQLQPAVPVSVKCRMISDSNTK